MYLSFYYDNVHVCQILPAVKAFESCHLSTGSQPLPVLQKPQLVPTRMTLLPLHQAVPEAACRCAVAQAGGITPVIRVQTMHYGCIHVGRQSHSYAGLGSTVHDAVRVFAI
jgi:hypothetical protein